jgi:RNA polymerase sigma-70 factor (ECF subfamily)
MDAHPIPIETLLAHREWVRGVARAVVGDSNAAADVEQDAWLAALSSPPRNESAVRGWFRVVLRNRARRVGRTESQRERRETIAARPESTPSAAELAEVADTHRRVVQAVVELDEPYRGTILLRYFEGLAVEDVAARTSVPLDTARSRISHGLAKLRERLAREFGTDERPWALALAPLIAAPRASPEVPGAVVVGGTLMGMKTVAGVVVVATLAAFGWNAARPVAPRNSTEVAAVADVDAASARVAPAPRARSTAADDRDDSPRAAATSSAPKPPERTVAERLKDLVDPIDFSGDTPLVAIARIAEATKVPIVVTAEAALEMSKIGRLERVAEFESISGEWLLGQMTKRFIPKFVVEADRVVIVPSDGKWDATKPVVVPPPPPPPALPITVLGRVVDAQGVIVVGAEVVRVGADRLRSVTDVAGRYELKLRRPFGQIQARMSGRASSPRVAVDGQPGAQQTIDLVLGESGGTVRVRVVAEEPLTQTVGVDLVEPMTGDAKDRSKRFEWTDHGVAVFEGVPVGEAGVSAYCSGSCRGFEADATTAKVTAGGVADVEIRLKRKVPLAKRVEAARVTAKFRGTKLGDVLSALFESSNVDRCVPHDFEALTAERTVTLDFDATPLADALRDVCRQVGGGLQWKLSEEHDWIEFSLDGKK